jgi:hypothetical protein
MADDSGRYLRPANGSTEYKSRVIVFVHGLFGGSSTTWTNANGSYGPRMLTDGPVFKEGDVILFSTPD